MAPLAPPVRSWVAWEGGELVGLAPPGTRVSAVSLSASADDDAPMHLGVVAASGLFMVQLPKTAKPGDYLELCFTLDGKTERQTVRVEGEDTRPPPLRGLEDGLRLDVAADSLRLVALDRTLRISEPGTTLHLYNRRTGATSVVALDARGRLSNPASLPGQEGDRVTVTASDGRLGQSSGTSLLALAPPGSDLIEVTPSDDYRDAAGRPTRAVRRFNEPLFTTDVPLYRQIVQAPRVGDCFAIAGTAATAAACPERLRHIIRQRGQSYIVDLHTIDGKPRSVFLSNRLFVSSTGEPVYAGGSLGGAIIEKALVSLRGGSYRSVDNGGNAGDVMSQLTGLPDETKRIEAGGSEDWLWNRLACARAHRLPSCVGTRDQKEVDVKGRGLTPQHAYAVLDMAERDGVRQVKLLEPYHKDEPRVGERAADGVRDGEFWLPVTEVCKYFDFYYGVKTPA